MRLFRPAPPFLSRYLFRLLPLLRALAAVAVVLVLAWSFWLSPAWLELCAGLALFLFGMQCLEDGLRALAGSRLEQLIGRSTDRPRKGLLFGIGATMVLQSSTLVSLLTIAFVSTGLLSLVGALPILFGANLGATSGIWLLAVAGQNFSLAPAALPVLVVGVLGSAFGPRAKAAGRVLLGIAFIFLGIDWLKSGFDALGDGVDLSALRVDGLPESLVFIGVGLLMTVVLQSSHATLMLTLAALASGQITLVQGMAIAIGSNVGSSVSTAIVGMLASHRGGQRLALAHVLFNVVTAIIASLMLWPLAWLVRAAFVPFGLQDNALLQLALFHTLFNVLGVVIFWPVQAVLARRLIRWLPDQPEPAVLIPPEAAPAIPIERSEPSAGVAPTEVVAGVTGATALPSSLPSSSPASATPVSASMAASVSSPSSASTGATVPAAIRARYLSEAARATPATATMAIARELLHLERLGLEVISHAVFVPPGELEEVARQPVPFDAPPPPDAPDAAQLYQQLVKGVYSDLLAFIARLDTPADEALQRLWSDCSLAARQLVDAVKDAGQLQKNLGRYLRGDVSEARDAYVALRRFLIRLLADIRESGRPGAPLASPWPEPLDEQAADFELRFRARLVEALRHHGLDGLAFSSLVNDLGHANGIVRGLRDIRALAQGHEVFRALWRQADEGGEAASMTPAAPVAPVAPVALATPTTPAASTGVVDSGGAAGAGCTDGVGTAGAGEEDRVGEMGQAGVSSGPPDRGSAGPVTGV